MTFPETRASWERVRMRSTEANTNNRFSFCVVQDAIVEPSSLTEPLCLLLGTARIGDVGRDPWLPRIPDGTLVSVTNRHSSFDPKVVTGSASNRDRKALGSIAKIITDGLEDGLDLCDGVSSSN